MASHISRRAPGEVARSFGIGVAATCRWLACAANAVHHGPLGAGAGAVTRHTRLAHEELIEGELLAAEVQAIRNPGGIDGRPGWLEGIVVTLRWACCMPLQGWSMSSQRCGQGSTRDGPCLVRPELYRWW